MAGALDFRPAHRGIATMHRSVRRSGVAAKEVSSASQITAEGQVNKPLRSKRPDDASLEEISSMTKRNAENAINSATLGRQTRESPPRRVGTSPKWAGRLMPSSRLSVNCSPPSPKCNPPAGDFQDHQDH